MPAPLVPAVRDVDQQWRLQLEGYEAFGGHSHLSSPRGNFPAGSSRRARRCANRSAFTAARNGSDNRAENSSAPDKLSRTLVCSNSRAIGAFQALRCCINRVSLSISGNGFNVQDQIPIPRAPHDEFDIRSPWYRQLSVTPANVIGNPAIVDSAVARMRIDELVGSYRKVGSWFNATDRTRRISVVMEGELCPATSIDPDFSPVVAPAKSLLAVRSSQLAE